MRTRATVVQEAREGEGCGRGSGVARARVEARRNSFDLFAERSVESVSEAPFFACCVLLVVIWALLVGNFTYCCLKHRRSFVGGARISTLSARNEP